MAMSRLVQPLPWLKPQHLRPGDTVAVVAPSGPVPRRTLARGVAELERMGLSVRLGANVLARHGRLAYLAGDDVGRGLDLLALWANPSVRAIFAARGGYGSARLADALTPSFLRRHPKIFCGFSDLTSVHAACARARLVSFYGPMVAWDLAHGAARAPGARAAKALASAAGRNRSGGYDAASFAALLFGDGKVGARAPGAAGARSLVLAPPGCETLVPGRASGRLAGGCLSLLVADLGTGTAPETRGTILVLEDELEPPYRVDRMLTQLRRSGLLGGVRGIVLGDFPECHPPAEAGYTLRDVFQDRLGDLGVPVLYRFPCGHTARPNVTLPLGARVTLDATRRRLTIDENVTR